MSCCACSTSGQPEPAPAMTIVAEPTTITEGWQMTGLASGRKGLRHLRRDVPILQPIEQPVEWSERELHEGVRVIELCVDAEDPTDAYLKVLGSDPKRVYATWQRVAVEVGDNGWFDTEEQER